MQPILGIICGVACNPAGRDPGYAGDGFLPHCLLSPRSIGYYIMSQDNLFNPVRQSLATESIDTLLQCRNVSIERIVSPPQTRTREFNQTQDEWVCLLQGSAMLELAGEALTLEAGDSLFIPAHTPHRVLTTSEQPDCIWLAVHIH